MKYHNDMSTSALLAEREGIFKYVAKPQSEYNLTNAEACLASVEEVLRKYRGERLVEPPTDYTRRLQTCADTRFEVLLDKVVVCVRRGLRKYCYLHRKTSQIVTVE